MMPLLRRLLAACSLLACGAALAADPAPAAIPVQDFFQNPVFGGASLSPSGRMVAVVVGAPGSRDRLAVVDLETMKVRPVMSFSDADIDHVQWISDSRLVFDLRDRHLAQADQQLAAGLYAVNADGTRYRQLVERDNPFVRDGNALRALPWNTFLLGQAGAQDSDDVFVVQPQRIGAKGAGDMRLLRLNTLSGRSEEIDAPADAFQWLLDAKGNLRAVRTEHDGLAALHWRDPASGRWRKLREFDRYTGASLDLKAVAPDGQLYVTARPGRDMEALYLYDPLRDQLAAKPLLASPQYDIAPQFITRDDQVLGVRFTIDAEVTQWFDAGIKAHQAEVDRLLPATANMLTPPRRGDSPWMLVRAFSDVQPAAYFLYHAQTKKLARLGAEQPGIRPAQMSRMDMVRYKARDGLEIPAYLTLPQSSAAKKKLPLVVYVHGGPWARTAWDWQGDVQFLASRGYAVLQPQFRGSTGFGDKHLRAGFKQWGLAMQDDLADAARWAIAQGIADPGRICIMGASYGGYATLMGLARDGDLFRCGVEWAGVSDILLMFDAHWSDLSDEWKRYGMPQMIGDRERDLAQLEATSPLKLAARIKNPLLIAHGLVDRRVPIEHGRRLRDALKAHNPDVEWVEYEKDGHGWGLPQTQADWWGRVEKFLARHLGAPPN